MAYFLLIQRDGAASEFGEAFGDRDRECVEFERADYRDHGARAANLRIIKFPRVPTRGQVAAKLAEINAPLAFNEE